ncbi:MAG: lamin tail domain-containing protein [Pyrinomonadaceae bacterium]
MKLSRSLDRTRSIRLTCLLLCCSSIFIGLLAEDPIDAARVHGWTVEASARLSGLETVASLVSLRSGPPAVLQSEKPAQEHLANAQFSIPGPFLIQTCTPPTGIIISEFRLRGPGGVNDEFVELYNNTDAAITLCTADGSSGWAVASSDGTVRFVIPTNTVIPARGHYLATGSAYSLSTQATSDLSYASGIPDNVGIALFNTANPANFNTGNRFDAVGFTSDSTLYREGTGLTAIGVGNVEYTLRRNLELGTPADTNSNSADIQFLSTDASFGSKLGAPGPENLSSPIQRNAHVPGFMLDGTISSSLPPNRVRDLTPGPTSTSTLGTLSLRRRFVNNTGGPVTRLRFRITKMTTFPPPSGTADLRAITSTAIVTMNINDAATCAATGTPATPPCTVTVQGTTLEEPPAQPNGGGYNATLSVGLPQPLAAAASVNVQFLLGVQQSGSFNFFINVEASSDSASPRLDPGNQTGGQGEDPLSRNFNWSVPLVSLPGRAGLDLGLSLTYNSLVWTKSNSAISFDDDRGFPSPGFRLGFPVIQPLYFNPQVGKYAYLMITPNGDRVELRQVGSSTLFEAADSSYLLLDTGTNPMTLRTTDGTQLSFEWNGVDYQCTKIKDRNGNFITINYTEFGRIDTVIDTLSRTIKFNYDPNTDNLTTITQSWTVNGAPHTQYWATFAYLSPNLSIQTNFPPGLTVPDDSVQKITDARGASQTFSYNNRHLVNGITYAAPAGITVPTAPVFGYDAAGNRVSMTDGLGSKTYTYNQLSRLMHGVG